MESQWISDRVTVQNDREGGVAEITHALSSEKSLENVKDKRGASAMKEEKERGSTGLFLSRSPLYIGEGVIEQIRTAHDRSLFFGE